MPGVTTSNLTGLLNEVTPQLSIDAVENKTWPLEFFPMTSQRGDTAYRWKVRTSGNTGVESFAEGQAEPVAGAQTYTAANLAWANYRIKLRIERIAIEDARDVDLVGDLVSREVADAEKDLVEDMTDDVYGTAAVPAITGIASAVDSTGTYAGIAKATITVWASYESDVSTGVDADITTALDDLRTPARKGRPTHILANETESRVIAGFHDGNVAPTYMLEGGADGMLYRGGYTGVTYDGGVSLVTVPGYTANEVIIIQRDDWLMVTHRDFLLDPWQLEGDAIHTTLSWRGQLVCLHAGRQGKLTTF